MKTAATVLGAGLLGLTLVGGAAQAATTISNSDGGISLFPFGSPNSQTYGEVFTAPVSGTLTSFSLSLDGGVGDLYGGVGTWNGGAGFGLGFGSPTNLYQSAGVASTGAQTFTFSPNVAVTSGNQYVVYLSVFGDADADAMASMPLGTNVSGLDYFVWNDTSAPQGNTSWNYSFNANDLFPGVGQALTSLTISSVPEPSTWAMMALGFGLLGLLGYRKTRSDNALA
jgi:PEP-CTERM motif